MFDLGGDVGFYRATRAYSVFVGLTVVPLKSKDFKAETAPDEKVGDKLAAVVKATGPDGKTFTIYFDKETGLPIKTIATVMGFQGDDVKATGDERLLRRALRNLLENARRYGGGEIRVELEDKSAAGVEIRVSDNGPGVPDAYRERIFEPFFRLPGHAERAGGVGLGLALVRQIVERHNGRIRCIRPPEGGGCFVISLPVGAKA